MPIRRTLKRAFTDRLTGVRTAESATEVGITATQARTFSPQKGRSVEFRVDTFTGDFGTIRLHPSNWLDDQKDGLCLFLPDVEVRYAELPSITPLPDAGGGPIRQIRAVAALVLRSAGLNQGMFNLGS